MLATGLALAILCGVSGGALLRYASGLAPTMGPQEVIDQQNEEFDTISINQVYDNYVNLFAGRNMPEWEESEIKGKFVQSGHLRTIAWGLLGLAGLGLILAAASPLVKKRSR